LGIEGFDLDPAATAGNAKAAAFFDRDADGTSQPWFGYVWLNPPFSRSMKACGSDCARKTCQERGGHLLSDQHGAKDFAAKAVLELEAGRVRAVAWHGPVAPDTDWYAALWPFVAERHDFSGRIAYNGGDSGGTFPSQTLVLLPRRRWGSAPTFLVSQSDVDGGA
jgi:hypothetical protein